MPRIHLCCHCLSLAASVVFHDGSVQISATLSWCRQPHRCLCRLELCHQKSFLCPSPSRSLETLTLFLDCLPGPPRRHVFHIPNHTGIGGHRSPDLQQLHRHESRNRGLGSDRSHLLQHFPSLNSNLGSRTNPHLLNFSGLFHLQSMNSLSTMRQGSPAFHLFFQIYGSS